MCARVHFALDFPWERLQYLPWGAFCSGGGTSVPSKPQPIPLTYNLLLCF